MASKPILNSVTLNVPVDGGLNRTSDVSGKLLKSLNGTGALAYRATKYVWDVTWHSTTLTPPTLSTSVTFVDETGTSYTVIAEPGSHKVTPLGEDGGVVMYTHSITLRQV